MARVDERRRKNGEVSRSRKLGTIEMLWLMLAVSLNAGRNSLHEILRLTSAELGINWTVSVAGFCKARFFSLGHLHFLHGQLVLKLFPRRGNNSGRWKGHTVKAADKTTVNLPEWPKLFAKFGSHRGCRGSGPICVEVCCLFAVLPRIPLAWVTGKSSTNERPMLKRLMKKLRKGDLLLVDNGFFSFKLLETVVARGCSFVIPLQKNSRPKVIGKLGDHDWLVEIADSKYGSAAIMQLRMVYVYRRGFRRRILTSLLDPIAYSTEELETSTINDGI